MTWRSFQDEAFTLTVSEAKPLEREILANYNQALRDINAELEAVYAKILSDVSPETYYTEMLKKQRLEQLLAQVRSDYLTYANKNGILTGEILKLEMTNAYYRKMYATNWLSSGTVFATIPPELVEYTVYGTRARFEKLGRKLREKIGDYTPKAGTLSSFLQQNKLTEIAKIERAIIQGFVQGKSYTAMTKDIGAIIGKAVKADGMVSYTGAKASAMRIVRTEGTRVMNAGALRQTQTAEAEGVRIKRIWLATLDRATRSTHGRLDGKEENKNGQWCIGNDCAPYPGQFGNVKNNANCRCTTIDQIEDRPILARRGRNPQTGRNEAFTWRDYPTWAEEKGLKKNKYGKLG